jgi:hypothetical protein
MMRTLVKIPPEDSSMKKTIIILTAAALAFPAIALNAQQEGRIQLEKLRPGPKTPAATLGHNLVVLHTGRPLSEAEKRDFLAKTMLQFRGAPAKPGAAPKTTQYNSTPAELSISPSQMVANGFEAIGNNISWFPALQEVAVSAGTGSSISLTVTANSNTMYLVTVKAHVYSASAQFTVTPNSGLNARVTNMPAQTVNVVGDPANGTDQEFAFAFDTTNSGVAAFDISLSSGWWTFSGAELMTQ